MGRGGVEPILMTRGDMSVMCSYLILLKDIVMLATKEVIIKNGKKYSKECL
jgi:hypothetical protein